jgi:hypothetical protein
VKWNDYIANVLMTGDYMMALRNSIDSAGKHILDELKAVNLALVKLQ